jgi:hypothetical protein
MARDMMGEPAVLWSFLLIGSACIFPSFIAEVGLGVMASENGCHVTGGETAATRGYDREEVLGW